MNRNLDLQYTIYLYIHKPICPIKSSSLWFGYDQRMLKQNINCHIHTHMDVHTHTHTECTANAYT